MRDDEFILLNGRMVRAAAARVSVFDRGLQYGDGLIETIRLCDGRPVALTAHLQRLSRSASALGIPIPPRAWEEDLRRVVARNAPADLEAWARITVTRGTSARGLLPPAAPVSTVVVAAGALDPAIARLRRHGVRVITLDFGRGSALADHKHAFYLPSIEGKRRAAAAGADDGLFVGPGGTVECATTANLFAVIDDVLVTPRGGGVLPGITRERALAAARARGWRIRERRLPRGELARAAEVFLTNSLFEVVPVVGIDGEPVGDGRPGERTRALRRALLAEPRGA